MQILINWVIYCRARKTFASFVTSSDVKKLENKNPKKDRLSFTKS